MNGAKAKNPIPEDQASLMKMKHGALFEMRPLDLSVILVNWNGKELLNRCLDSVFLNTRGIEYEVLVVDNGSEDGSEEMVKKDFPDVLLLRNQRNEGFSRACNQGIRASCGKKILLLNSDTVVQDNAIREMVDFLDRNPRAGLAGCMLLNEDGSYQKSAGKVRNVANEMEERLIRFGLKKRIRPLCRIEERFAGRARSIDWVSGAFLMIRRSVADEIGLLDERLFLFFEDIEWCTRARDAGWHVMYNPDVRVIHSGGGSTAKAGDRSFLEYRKSQLLFYQKRYGNGSNTRILKHYLFFVALLGIMRTGISGFGGCSWGGEDPAFEHRMYRDLLHLVRST